MRSAARGARARSGSSSMPCFASRRSSPARARSAKPRRSCAITSLVPKSSPPIARWPRRSSIASATRRPARRRQRSTSTHCSRRSSSRRARVRRAHVRRDVHDRRDLRGLTACPRKPPRNAAERRLRKLVPMLRSSLFIVRVWRQRDRRGAAAFRASVRAVNAERGRVFTRPSDLARYLLRNCRTSRWGRTQDEARRLCC